MSDLHSVEYLKPIVPDLEEVEAADARAAEAAAMAAAIAAAATKTDPAPDEKETAVDGIDEADDSGLENKAELDDKEVLARIAGSSSRLRRQFNNITSLSSYKVRRRSTGAARSWWGRGQVAL